MNIILSIVCYVVGVVGILVHLALPIHHYPDQGFNQLMLVMSCILVTLGVSGTFYWIARGRPICDGNYSFKNEQILEVMAGRREKDGSLNLLIKNRFFGSYIYLHINSKQEKIEIDAISHIDVSRHCSIEVRKFIGGYSLHPHAYIENGRAVEAPIK